ncbi:MAG: ATP-binding cassette domain-containing protein [Phycisphaerales bacterium]|nr:ATP-binding cassette domain-containing protein [Phycisphaerales bacterium]
MTTSVLAFHDIHFSRDSRPILSGISWQVAPRQIAAVLGPNGSGKSTLLRLASAYLWPQQGSIQLLGQTLGEVPVAPLRAQIGIVESTAIYPFDEDMTAHDVATSGYFSALTLGYITPTRHQRDHARHLIDQVGLSTHADQLYHTLSTGERLRALLARALVRKPKILLLDEPTAALDLPARETILATLARLHKQPHPPTIITVTHHLEELLPDTQNILLLSSHGQIVSAGPPESALTSAMLSTAYNLPIHLTRHNGRYHAHIDPATWNDLLQ